MNAIAINFSEFVQIQNNQTVTTSEFIAKAFNKNHKDVLRKIDEILTQVPDFFGKRNFTPTEKHTKNNLGFDVVNRSYELTKDGFMLLVMGFTGKQAMQIKIAYIEAFNAMAAQLQQRMSNQDLGDILSECFADTQQRQHNTPALPQNLTSQQQSEVKKFHRQLVQAVPKEQQAKLALTLWSSVKSKFGVSYKQVPTEQYTEILSLMARVAVEKSSALHGELLDKQPEKINAHELADFELARVTQYLQQSYMMMQLMFRAHVGGGLSNEYSQELRQRLHDNLPFLRGLVYQLNRFRGKIHDPLSAKQFNEHMAFLNQITPRCLEIA